LLDLSFTNLLFDFKGILKQLYVDQIRILKQLDMYQIVFSILLLILLIIQI